jgi:hypothetical protein
MRLRYTRAAVGAALCALVAAPVFAQHEGHQMPGAGTPSPAAVSSCAQSSEGVTRTIDALSGRIDEARQTNDAAKMRAAVADLQVALAQMKTQLADCTALTQTAGSAMGSMTGMDHSKTPMVTATPAMQPGSPPPASAAAAGGGAMAGTNHAAMDHSKMQMAPKPAPGAGSPASAVAAASPATATPSTTAQAPAVVFALRTQPAPPRSGKNDFEVTVNDMNGKPIADAEVSLAFYMPPMPAMNMPEMRNTAQLTSAGNGIYKGSATIAMAGDWDVTITAARKGQTLGTNKMRLSAK